MHGQVVIGQYVSGTPRVEYWIGRKPPAVLAYNEAWDFPLSGSDCKTFRESCGRQSYFVYVDVQYHVKV